MIESREDWANNKIARWDPSFRHRWTIFNNTLSELQDYSKICLDVGCGYMSELSENLNFKAKIGTDFLTPKNRFKFPFLRSDLYSLPFKNKSVDIILLRFVTEHIEFPQKAFEEFYSVLKPNGKILIMTTNIKSPIIFVPKLMPYSIRRNIILKIFNAADEDVFETYHRINSYEVFKSIDSHFRVIKWWYVQDINWTSNIVFYFFLFWHLFSKWTGLKILRSNIVVLLRKVTP